MSEQADNLSKIKPIVLTPDKLHPGQRFKAVGHLSDGRTIWEGPVFAGNPRFQDHEDGVRSDDGHARVPLMDPEDPTRQRYKRNHRGEPVLPLFRGVRREKIVRGVMQDFGNGSAGLIPVPTDAETMQRQAEHAKQVDEFQKKMADAALKRGITADQLLDALLQTNAPQAEPRTDEPVKYPDWKGRGGWELSDGSRLARLEGESNEDYKQRALDAQAALDATA